MVSKGASCQNQMVFKGAQELNNQTTKCGCDLLLKTWYLENLKVIFEDLHYLPVSLTSAMRKLGETITGNRISG